MKTSQIDLPSLGAGVVNELFDDALEKVIENIADKNTNWKKDREIIIKLKIKPNEDRSSGTYSVDVNTKLAGVKPHIGTLYMGKDRAQGKYIAKEVELEQEEIDFEEKPENIHPLTDVSNK